MAVSVRITRVLGALALSAALIGGVFIITAPHFSLSFLNPGIASAASTASALEAYSQKDSDNDGLPDWEEALYGTDPHNAHSVSPTLTDGQAVAQGLVTPKAPTSATASSSNEDLLASVPGQLPAAGSLTEQFAQEFYTQVVQASNGEELTDDQQQTIVNQLLSDFSQKAQALLVSQYSSVDVHIDNSVTAAEYADSVEQILTKNDLPPGTADPLQLASSYVQNNDASAGEKLQKLSTAYASIATQLQAVSVPYSLSTEQIDFVQSFDTLSKATQAIVNYQADPIETLGALGVIVPESKSFAQAISGLAAAVLQTGEPAAGAPGALIVSMARSAKGS